MQVLLQEYFKNKKITVMGLGLLGRGINIVKFLAKHGAQLTVTDLKSESELGPSLEVLRVYQNITYVLGEHRLRDFCNVDMIIKAAGVSLNSPYIEEARKHNIPVEMDASLFAKLTDATLIGVTGTRGKSTTTQLLYEILKKDAMNNTRNVFLGGNVRGVATLPLLEVAGKSDLVVLELDSWQLQGFGEANISPHIAVFTNFLFDHMNYYGGDMKLYFNDKANIFQHQGTEDYLVVSKEADVVIKERYKKLIRSTVIIASTTEVSNDWNIHIPGLHNKKNIALAVRAARILGVAEQVIKTAVEHFNGIPGRLEYVRTVRGIQIFNDTTATTPDATLAGLQALSKNKNIVLIMGGSDKELDMTPLLHKLVEYCKKIILLPGSGSERIKEKLMQISELKTEEVDGLRTALSMAMTVASDGDIVLLSPAFASFGLFKNEYDRGDQFVEYVKKI